MESSAAERLRIANLFSPVFTATRERLWGMGECRYNIPATVDFDGNWDPRDNEEHYDELLEKNPDIPYHPDSYRTQGMSKIYYAVVMSGTHAFLTYYLFYPNDAGSDCFWGGHENDASSVMLIVRRHGSNGEPVLERVLAQDHGDIKSYTPDRIKRLQERPAFKVTSGSHGMEPVKPSEFLEGFDYRFGTSPSYDLVDIHQTLWPRRNDKTLFCGRRVEGTMEIGAQFCGFFRPPWAPWSRSFTPEGSNGHSFFDPINAFRVYYPNHDERNYASTYDYNPYQVR